MKKKIYAFVKSWSPDGESFEAVRARLRASDTDMQVLSSAGVWNVAGDEVQFSDRMPADPMTAALLTRLREGRDAVFVCDDRGVTFSQSWETQ